MLPDGRPDIKGITLGKSSTPLRFRNIFLEAVKALQGVDSTEKLTQAHSKVVGYPTTNGTASAKGVLIG